MKQLLLAVLWVSISACAQDRSVCSAQTPLKGECRIALEQLHPTQGGVGMIQVEDEVAGLKNDSPQKIEKRIAKKVIPIVIAQNASGELTYYLVDRHHLASALWRVGVREAQVTVVVKIAPNEDLWGTMVKNHWVWLKDAKGQSIKPEQLPQRIADMTDYPYRSLAGMIEDDGYFNKWPNPYFAEFVWAEWLGQQMNWQAVTRDQLAQQRKQAEKLACSPQAKGLPGYPGRACLFD